MTMSPDRLICGMATVFDRPSRNGISWTPKHFEQFLSLEIGLPLLVDHGGLVNSWGVTDHVGTVRRLVEVTQPLHGLLILAELDYADGWGDSLLDDITSILHQRWLPAGWGFSVAAYVAESDTWPYEISLTRSPAFEDALVLAAGPQALATFELLAEPAAAPGALQDDPGSYRP